MITTSKDILMALGTDKAPEEFMVTLGYAGWEAGQLESELQNNSWLTIDADSDILFNTPIELRWKKATQKLGIDVAHLSSDIGHA
jgi:putative transcriptional regulator